MKDPCVAVHNHQHSSQSPRPEVTQQAQIINNTTTLSDTAAVLSSATHVLNNDYDQSQLLSVIFNLCIYHVTMYILLVICRVMTV